MPTAACFRRSIHFKNCGKVREKNERGESERKKRLIGEKRKFLP